MIKPTTRHRRNSIPVLKDLFGFLVKTGFNHDEFVVDLENDVLKTIIEGIKSDHWKTDQEASLAIFKRKSDKQYNQCKRQLRDKLVHAILISEVPKQKQNSELATQFINANRLYVAHNILIAKNHSTAASYLGEILIAQSIRYGFTEFAIKIAQHLIEYYSISNLDKKKVEYYKSVIAEFTLAITWENKTVITYSQMMNLFIKELSPGTKAIAIADEFKINAQPIVHKVISNKFHIHYYLIIIFRHIAAQDFKSMDLAAQNGLNYFRSLKLRMFRTENIFLKKRVEANLSLGNIDLCQKLLNEILSQTKEYNSNWFNTLEIQVIILIHQNKYDKAIQEFQKGRKHKAYDTISPITKKRWGLLEAYINFLQRTISTSDKPTMSRYKINKFINETPVFSEDKKGRNIQLIIAQLLFYILDKNWDRMEEKIEALQKYGSRYLRKNDLFRSQVFIKMLLEIPKRMYHPEAIIRHTAKYRKRLEEIAPNIDLNGSTLEVIPYEHLWELILPNIVPPKYTRTKKLSKTFK